MSAFDYPIPKAPTGIDLNKGWAVLYTDGGAYPNNSSAESRGGGGVWGYDSANNIYRSVIPEGPFATNNSGELLGFIEALELALSLNYPFVEICPDSSYVIDGYKGWMAGWKKNGWKRKDRKSGDMLPVSNEALWRKVDALKEKLASAGITVALRWVKGHNGNYGNEMADELATQARKEAESGKLDRIHTVTERDVVKDVEESVVEATEVKTKPEKPTKPQPITGLMEGRLMPYMGHSASNSDDNRHYYYTYTSNRTNDAERGPLEWLGSNSAVTRHGCIASLDAIEPLELLVRAQNSRLEANELPPCVLHLDAVTKKSVWENLLADGKKTIKPQGKRIALKDGTRVSEPVTPPRRMFFALERLDELHRILYLYLADKLSDTGLIETDVTEYFVAPKGKRYEAIKGFDAGTKSITVPLKELDYDLVLTPGLDLPTRNAVSRVAKTANSMAVKVLHTPPSESTLRYYVLIETDTEAGLFTAPYANTVFRL